MSEIEIICSNESDNNESNNEQENFEDDQQENFDFVDWINSFTFEENSNLTYPFDKWQTYCVLFWILMFIIVAIVFVLLSR